MTPHKNYIYYFSWAILFVFAVGLALTIFNIGRPVIFQNRAAGGDSVSVTSDPKLGGAIISIALNGQNIVDTTDCGRLLQFAAFDGSRQLPQQLRCSGSSGQGFIWNPTQACAGSNCGANNPSNGQNITPVLWDSKSNPGDLNLNQQIKNEGGNLWSINAQVSLNGNTYGTTPGKYYYGGYGAYTIPQYSEFITYDGSSPWTNGPVTIKNGLPTNCNTDPGLQKSSEPWAAIVNPATGKGITFFLVTNNSNQQWQYWPHVHCSPDNVMSPPYLFNGLRGGSQKIYFYVGSWQDGRALAYKLNPQSTPIPTKPLLTPPPSKITCHSNGDCIVNQVCDPITNTCIAGTPLSTPTPTPQAASCQGNSNPPAQCFDCKKDGQVNILDFACFAKWYGKGV